MTKIKLELISDIDMYLFAGKGMRGGISYIAKRHSKAKNKYMESYDVNKPSKFFMYLDANNLYGWAMRQYLPYGRSKWLNEKEIDKFDVNSIECNSFEKKNSSDGYILEVDLESSDELHELQNDYPLTLEKLKINHNMLSNYCSNTANGYRIKIGRVNKLVPNLGNKSKYVLHYKKSSVVFVIKLGIKLTKVHRILKFKQLDSLKTYIDFNKNERKNDGNSFKKDFF